MSNMGGKLGSKVMLSATPQTVKNQKSIQKSQVRMKNKMKVIRETINFGHIIRDIR